MSDNKLNLLVKFTGVDKLSSSIKNIMGTSKSGTKSIRDLNGQARELQQQLKAVGREIGGSSGNITNLINKENRLEAELAAVNSQLDKQKSKLERIGNIQAKAGKVAEFTGKAGAAMTLGVTTPILAFGASSIHASRDASAAVAQVNASLASMGPAAGRSLGQLKGHAEELMKTSLFDDDEILRKVTANMLTFSKVNGTTFDRAQQAAVNLSTKLDGDLQGATLQVGKALQDPVKGVTALTRAGVSFTGEQKAMIKSMAEAGNMAGAQNIILSELEKQFGGSAAAARKADPGGALALSYGELQQAIGDKLIPVLIPFIEKLSSLMDAFANLSGPVQNAILIGGGLLAVLGPLLMGISGIAVAVGALAPVFAGIGTAIGFVVPIIGGIVTAIGIVPIAIAATIAAIGYAIYSNWDKIKAFFNGLPAWMKSIGSMMMQGLLMALNPALLVNKLTSIAKTGVTAFKNYFGIKSPSRLFMEMGGHINEGLGIGLERGRGHPVRAVGRMAGAVAGAGAMALSPAASARAGPITIRNEFVIHQQAGEDAEALAQRVARLVEQAQRGKRLRSYEDKF